MNTLRLNGFFYNADFSICNVLCVVDIRLKDKAAYGERGGEGEREREREREIERERENENCNVR